MTRTSPISTASCPTGLRRRRKDRARRYQLDVDIGFHEFESARRAAAVTVEVWVDERSFAASDERGRRLDYDFLRTGSARSKGRRFNLQERSSRDLRADRRRRGVTALRVATGKPDIYRIAPASAWSWRASSARVLGRRAGPGRRAPAGSRPGSPRFSGPGFAQRLRRQTRRQRAGEPVPEQVRARAARRPRRRSRTERPTSAAARRGAEDVQRDRPVARGLQEDLGLAFAGQRAGDMEGAADAGGSRRGVGRRQFAQDRAQPLGGLGRIRKLGVGRDQPQLGPPIRHPAGEDEHFVAAAAPRRRGPRESVRQDRRGS